MFFADWNDCLNLEGNKHQAESVLVGMMLVHVASDMAKMADSAEGHPTSRSTTTSPTG